MEDTGCPECDRVRRIRDSIELCIDCQIDYWDHQASAAMATVEQLKKKRDAIQPPDTKDN